MNNREILLLQETERKRIAEALHDTTVQDMICLSQQLEMILLSIDQEPVQAKLEAAVARRQVKRMISDMRETIYDLRPMMLDDIGWHASIERLKDKLSYDDPNLNVHFDVDTVDMYDGITAISIYRIIHESCQNVIKHSCAENMEVSVKCKEKLIVIRICDDGVGMTKIEDSQKNHFGIQFMRERVDALSGTMQIISDSSGTLIEVKIPIERKVKEI